MVPVTNVLIYNFHFMLDLLTVFALIWCSIKEYIRDKNVFYFSIYCVLETYITVYYESQRGLPKTILFCTDFIR